MPPSWWHPTHFVLYSGATSFQNVTTDDPGAPPPPPPPIPATPLAPLPPFPPTWPVRPLPPLPPSPLLSPHPTIHSKDINTAQPDLIVVMALSSRRCDTAATSDWFPVF